MAMNFGMGSYNGYGSPTSLASLSNPGYNDVTKGGSFTPGATTQPFPGSGYGAPVGFKGQGPQWGGGVMTNGGGPGPWTHPPSMTPGGAPSMNMPSNNQGTTFGPGDPNWVGIPEENYGPQHPGTPVPVQYPQQGVTPYTGTGTMPVTSSTPGSPPLSTDSGGMFGGNQQQQGGKPWWANFGFGHPQPQAPASAPSPTGGFAGFAPPGKPGVNMSNNPGNPPSGPAADALQSMLGGVQSQLGSANPQTAMYGGQQVVQQAFGGQTPQQWAQQWLAGNGDANALVNQLNAANAAAQANPNDANAAQQAAILNAQWMALWQNGYEGSQSYQNATGWAPGGGGVSSLAMGTNPNVYERSGGGSSGGR